MTIPSTITSPHVTSGVTNAQKSASAKAPAQAGGLMGFLTVLLQNAQQAQAAGAGKTADFAAKIAALMEKNGGTLDLAALEQILPPGLAKAIADKLAAFQQTQTTDITPTLTSDLTAASAVSAQDETMLQELAAQLNALEPGADPLTEQVATVQDDMMASLIALQGNDDQSIIVSTNQASPLALQAADASAQALRASTTAATQSPLLVSQGLAADASSGEPVAGDARGITITPAAVQNAADKAAPTVTSPAASLVAQMQQTAPQPIPNAFSGMFGSSLGALNSMLSGGMGGDTGGFDQGFNQQSGFGFDANSIATGTDGLKATAANPNGFINYMTAAAKTGQSATTQMVGMQISRNANAKIDTFTMQLEPADLGLLEVRMSFGKDGKVSAKLIADKPETLSLLQRDSVQLERILQQSGLDVSENALSFDLRDQSQQSMYDGAGDSKHNNMYAGRGDHAHKNAGDITAQLAIQTQGYISQTGVNIMV